METYESELIEIISRYLKLVDDIKTWQKSLPLNPPSSTKAMGIIKQFRMHRASTYMFFEGLDVVERHKGGIARYLKEEIDGHANIIPFPKAPAEKAERVCKSCSAPIGEAHHWAKYCDNCRKNKKNPQGGLLNE